MKKYCFLAMACLTLIMSSCQKEKMGLADAGNNSSLAPNTSMGKKGSLDPYPGPNKNLKYGALICTPDPFTSLSFTANVASQLGVSYLRARTLVPNSGNLPIMNLGYKILLNFNSTTQEQQAAPFVTDLPKYKADLTNILSLMAVLPEVAVIENEESNMKYYSGTPEEYLKELNTAITVMHAYGIKVANGGITDQGLNYLVYQDYLDRGMEAEAEDFKQRENVTPKSAKTQDRGAFVKKLLQGYQKLNLDYVNFHWKGNSTDTKSLGEVIAYLKRETGKPVINNELGQFDKDPNTLLAHVQQCTNDELAYIIWYSPTEKDDKKSTPLHYDNQSLTETGFAYRDYLAK